MGAHASPEPCSLLLLGGPLVQFDGNSWTPAWPSLPRSDTCISGVSFSLLLPESEHDCGPGLVPGPAEDDESEGGGDPLGQQMPPPSPASREDGQVSLLLDPTGGTFPAASL